MKALIQLFKEYQAQKQSLILEITYDKVADWSVYIEHRDSQTVICSVNSWDLELAASKAYRELYKWWARQ